MVNNYQGSDFGSNPEAGAIFEAAAQKYFAERNLLLSKQFSVQVGITGKKNHRFDLGSDNPPVLVECKRVKWTKTGNAPSAKITQLTAAMYYFLLAPETFRKVLFVLRHCRPTSGESLAEYYVKLHGHLIPRDVEILDLMRIQPKLCKCASR